ncbi:MAG TPA: type II toxin-antitoxin system HicB family antitoxin [Nitrospira sp.]|nr:type II toxin-antitoxin system HicB family antitoxin [Nitrospira sp.]
MLTLTLEYWEGEDGWYVGQLREVPGVMSQGRSLDELQENIREAYELVIEESRSRQHHTPSFSIPISLPA